MYVRRHPELWLWMHRRWRDNGGPAERRRDMFPVGAIGRFLSLGGANADRFRRRGCSFAAIGIRQPVPNARSVTLSPGAACLRLNSARCTSRSTRSNRRRIESGRDDLVRRLMPLDVALQDLVEHVVGRQRILIGLVRAGARPMAPS